MHQLAHNQSERHLQQVRYVTANYQWLQGLRIVPLALLFLAEAAAKASGWRWEMTSAPWADTLSGVPYAAAFGLYYVIGAYYERSFGHVHTAACARESAWKTMLRVIAISAGIALPLFIARTVDQAIHIPVDLFWLTAGGLVFMYWYLQRSFRMHYLVIALLLVGMSMLPLVGLGTGDDLFTVGRGAPLALFGAILLVGGIFDHLLLVRTLKPVPGE